MDDAISRSALLQLCDMYTNQMISRRDICKAPALDVAPVVRCKDCKRALSQSDAECVKCTIWHEWMPINGFCSEGVRWNDQP